MTKSILLMNISRIKLNNLKMKKDSLYQLKKYKINMRRGL